MIELQKYSKLEADRPFRLSQTMPHKKYSWITVGVFSIIGFIIIYSLSVCYQKVDIEAFALQAYENDSETEVMKEYLNFIAKYGKVYASKYDTANRYRIFKSNYNRVMEHNQHEEYVPFTMEINKYSDLSDEEFEQTYARLRVPARRAEAAKDMKPKLTIPRVNVNLPESVNWYTEGKVTRPYDQGHCGSCWAFTTAATLESLAYISGSLSTLQEFSVQQLVDCDAQNFGCQGGWMYEGFEYAQAAGMMLKSDYSAYAGQQGICQFNAGKAVFKNINMVESDGLSNDQLKELVSKQPIAIAIYSTGMLSGYKKGVLTEDYLKCSRSDNEVNHGVTLVGYGKVQNGDRVRGWCSEYWVIRNSWGRDWGEEGFFKLCMDGVGSKNTPLGTCLVNKFATYPTM